MLETQKHRRSKQRAYYRKCRDLALQDPSIGILQRQEVNSVESCATVGAAPPPTTTTFIEPWTRALPSWLLLLPLYVHVETIAQTSYAQLLAYTRALEKQRNHIHQDYIKVQDRYRRFVQHVKARTAEWEREKAIVEASKENIMVDNFDGVSRSDMATIDKPKSRRVTASPGRIRPEPVMSDPSLRQRQQEESITQNALHGKQHSIQRLPNQDTNSLPMRRLDGGTTLVSRRAPLQQEQYEYHQSQMAKQDDSCAQATIHHVSMRNMQASVNYQNRMSDDDRQMIATSKHKQALSLTRNVSNPPLNGQSVDDDSQTIVPSPPKLPVAPQDPRCDPTSINRTIQDDTINVNTDRKRSKSCTKTGAGWISSRPAKEFVAEVAPPPLPPNPIGRSSKPPPSAANYPAVDETNVPARAFDPKPPPPAPYCEVVRNKAERQTLKPHECVECGKFIDAILEEDKEGVYSRHELMCASRHRHRFTPPDTPADFWELSFVDERNARQQQQQQQRQESSEENSEV